MALVFPFKNKSLNPNIALGQRGFLEITGIAFLLAVLAIIFISILTLLGETPRSASQLPQVASATVAPTPEPAPSNLFTTFPPTATPTRIPLEEGQPVSGNTAVFFLADKSRSMAYDGKIERERDIIQGLAERLGPDDIFSVIGFDSTVFVVVPPIKIAALLPVLKYRLGNLVAMGKTDLLPAMQQACKYAETTKVSQLHIVVMTDGKVPIVGDEYLTALQCLTKLGGHVTALGIGDDTDDPFLEMLSQYGKGITFKAVKSSDTVDKLISFFKTGRK